MTVKKRVAYKIPFDYRLFLFKVNYFSIVPVTNLNVI